MRSAATLCLLTHYVSAGNDIPDGCGPQTSTDCDCHLDADKPDWAVNKTRFEQIHHAVNRARDLYDLRKECYGKVKDEEESKHKDEYEDKCDKLKDDTLDKQKDGAKQRRKWAKGNATRDAKHQYHTAHAAAEASYKTSLQTATDDQKAQLRVDFLQQVSGLKQTLKSAEVNGSHAAEAAYKAEYAGFKQQYEEAKAPFIETRRRQDAASRSAYHQKVDKAVDEYAQQIADAGNAATGGSAPPGPAVGLAPLARRAASPTVGSAEWALAAVAAGGAAMLTLRRHRGAGTAAADESQYGSV